MLGCRRCCATKSRLSTHANVDLQISTKQDTSIDHRHCAAYRSVIQWPAYEHDPRHTVFDIGGVSVTLVILPEEIEWTAVRAQGAGGQNVNKVATAVQMRFDIRASSLPEPEKELLLQLHDRRITDKGVIVIKAQQFRTQERNKEQALAQLDELVRRATIVHKKRRPTRPTLGAKRKRLEQKQQRGQVKTLRSKPRAEDEGFVICQAFPCAFSSPRNCLKSLDREETKTLRTTKRLMLQAFLCASSCFAQTKCPEERRYGQQVSEAATDCA